VLDSTRYVVSRDGEPWCRDDRASRQPRIYEDGVWTVVCLSFGGPGRRVGGESEEETRIGIQVFDSDRHCLSLGVSEAGPEVRAKKEKGEQRWSMELYLTQHVDLVSANTVNS